MEWLDILFYDVKTSAAANDRGGCSLSREMGVLAPVSRYLWLVRSSLVQLTPSLERARVHVAVPGGSELHYYWRLRSSVIW